MTTKKDTTSRNKGRNKPLVKLVHNLEEHVVGGPHLFIDKVKGSVGNELVQVPVVVSLQGKLYTSFYYYY